jgi:6-phosphofructokinase 1
MKKHAAIESELIAALRVQPGLQGTGWEYLFDQEDRAIAAHANKLDGPPTFSRPHREHYKALARRIGVSEAEIFARDQIDVPACEDSRVAAVFMSKGGGVRLPRFEILGEREKYRLNPSQLGVGILTQGGMTPGYNIVIDSIVKRHAMLSTSIEGAEQKNPDGTSTGLRLCGFTDGFSGLGRHLPVELKVRETDKLALLPGSALRLNPEASESIDGDALCEAVRQHGIDVLYVIGDRNAMIMADQACEALQVSVGPAKELVRIVGAPVTIENDIAFTDTTIGFHTAVTSTVEFIQRVHSEAEACRYLTVVVLPGRYSGSLALHSAHASGNVDYALLPEMLTTSEAEQKEEFERAANLLVRRYHNKRHAVAVLSAQKAGGEDGAQEGGSRTASVLHRFMETLGARMAREPSGPDGWVGRIELRHAHCVGSSAPLPCDVDLGKLTGKLMVDAALSGLSRCVVCQWQGRFVAVPMGFATGRPKTVDLGSYGPRTMSEKYILTPVPRDPAPGQADEPPGSEWFG